VDPATSTIADARFKAFGCSAAIAVGSLVTVRLQGLSLDRAREVRAATLANDLALAEDRYHCAELGERAVLAAVSDYLNRRPTAQ
jgi:nitrogen fixation NifU-like protein